MTTADDRQQDLDRKRVIADPIRLDVYEALRIKGPLTSRELGELVPKAKSSMRNHLARLEFVGLASCDDQRRWSAVPVPLSYSVADPADDELREADDGLRRVTAIRKTSRSVRWQEDLEEGKWSPEWVDAAISRDFTECATPDEMDALDDALEEVTREHVDRWRKRRASENQPPPDLEFVFITLTGHPIDLGGANA